jgi:hypothetical protein
VEGEEARFDELLSSLARWAGDQRAAEAASARAREHWLRQQVGEASTVAGMLVDLAEQHAEVIVSTDTRVHRGALRAVGRDVVVLEQVSGTVTLVAIDAIRTLEPAPAHTGPDPTGSRSPAAGLSLAGVLDALAAAESTIRVELQGGKLITGSLRSIGEDVMTVRIEGRPARSLQIPLRAVASCSL